MAFWKRAVLGVWVLLGLIFYLVKAREHSRLLQAELDRLILGEKEKSRR